MKYLLLLFVLISPSLWAENGKKLCVFDPYGNKGEMYQLLKDYVLEMAPHGVLFDLIPYTDERLAVEAYISKGCDLVAATDIRLRPLVPFSGSISAVGALPTIQNLRTLLLTLNRPRAAKYLDDGEHSVVGIFPIGSAYLFVDDRTIDTLKELKNKKVAVLSYQPDAIMMTKHVGAKPIKSDLMTFAKKFNKGWVDACYAPAVVYDVFELNKGLKDKGGIVQYPLAQLTFQLVSHSGTLSKKQEKISRKVMLGMFDNAFSIINRHEKKIDPDYWIHISEEDKDTYREMFRLSRLGMKEEDVFDKKVLSIMRKIRCSDNIAAIECSRKIARE